MNGAYFCHKHNIKMLVIEGKLLCPRCVAEGNYMNKFICLQNKQNKKFERSMCQQCNYTSRCIDYQEYEQGHSDEIRDASQPEAEDCDKENV